MRVYQFRHIRAEGQCSRATRAQQLRTAACTVSILRRFALILPAVLGSLVCLPPRRRHRRNRPGSATARARRGGRDAAAAVARRGIARDRILAARTTVHRRLNVRAPASVSYLRTLASAQRVLQSRVVTTIPAPTSAGTTASSRTASPSRCRLAAPRAQANPGVNGLAVRALPRALDKTPQLIGAPAVWGSTLATAGQGMKIGIIDDGLDQSHVSSARTASPTPPGFPKGNTNTRHRR